MSRAIDLARKKIKEADAVLITAGAGMGVDSGLGEFLKKIGLFILLMKSQSIFLLLLDIMGISKKRVIQLIS